MSEKQTFDTKGNRHEFVVDGIDYYLPGVTYKDFEESIAIFEEDDPEARIAGFREFMRGRIRSDRFMFGKQSPKRVVDKLSPPQLGDLYAKWSQLGNTAGEASGSQVSTSNTDDK
jgi:hypothetical protein